MKSVVPLLACLLMFSGPARAQDGHPAAPVVGLDCWVGQEFAPAVIHYIRCIADRDLPHPVLPNPRTEALLDQLHRELHARSGAVAERLYRANIELVRESQAVWSIRIHTYPYEWSWAEGRPERLVRAVLCPEGSACAVMIRRD